MYIRHLDKEMYKIYCKEIHFKAFVQFLAILE
jgi:hypothetical protein